MTIRDLVMTVERTIVKNSPALMTSIAVIGTVSTAYLTGRATVTAMERIQTAEYDIRTDSSLSPHSLTSKEKVELVWKEYIPPLVMGALTVAAIVTSNRVSSRRAAALAVAYSISEKAFDEYKEKIVEKLGPKKEQAARDEIAQEQINRNPPKEVIFMGKGDILCREAFTGRYFKTTMEALRGARNTLNEAILHDFSASLTDFYYLVGLDRTDISDDIGWNSDKLMDILITSALTPDGEPCMSFTYSVLPQSKYYKLN